MGVQSKETAVIRSLISGGMVSERIRCWNQSSDRTSPLEGTPGFQESYLQAQELLDDHGVGDGFPAVEGP